MKIKRLHILLLMLLLGLGAVAFRARVRPAVVAAIQIAKGKKTVAHHVAQYGESVRNGLAPDFEQAGVEYPRERVKLVGLKAEHTVQVWASGSDRQWNHIKDYPILGMNGTLGPKLREGDRQVPEGLYRVESLNPNSLYHLALRVDYPNAEDRRAVRFDPVGIGEAGGSQDLFQRPQHPGLLAERNHRAKRADGGWQMSHRCRRSHALRPHNG